MTEPNNPFLRYCRFVISGYYGHAGMPDHTQIKPQGQTVAFMDILLHAKSKLSTSNDFGDIKIVHNLIGLEHFQLQLKN